MKRARRSGTRRRPQHARPSLLAPTRSVAIFAAFVVAVGLGLAGCAAVAGGGAKPIAEQVLKPAKANLRSVADRALTAARLNAVAAARGSTRRTPNA